MCRGLQEPGLRMSYKANIAMCIYDNRRPDGRLNHENCNAVADKIIDMIWGPVKESAIAADPKYSKDDDRSTFNMFANYPAIING